MTCQPIDVWGLACLHAIARPFLSRLLHAITRTQALPSCRHNIIFDVNSDKLALSVLGLQRAGFFDQNFSRSSQISSQKLKMKVQILHKKAVTPIEVKSENVPLRVEHLMHAIEETLGVFGRNQRLIMKGKTLQAKQTLNEAKV